MNQKYFKKYQKPNYNDIQKAKNGNQEAIQKIISIYQPYIYIHGKQKCYDFKGKVFYMVDEDMQALIEQKIRNGILKFNEK